MTIGFSCLAKASVAAWFLLSNVDASSDYSRSLARQPGKRNGKRKGKREVSHTKRKQVLIDLSDFDPIDIMDNEEEERILSLLESIDRGDVPVVTEKTKSKKTLKSKRKRVKRRRNSSLEQEWPTTGPPHPAIETPATAAATTTASLINETLCKPAILSRSVDVSPSHVDPTSVPQHDDPRDEIQEVQGTHIVSESARSIIIGEAQDEIGREIPRSILRSPALGEGSTQPTSQRSLQPLDGGKLEGPILHHIMEQHSRRESILHYLPQTPTSSHQTPQQQRPQQAQKLGMLEQRAAMLSYTTPWVIDFLQSRPNDALLAVPRDFLGDGFNLVHLPPLVERFVGSIDLSFPLYKAALRLILSTEQLSDVPPSIQRAAEILYALIHNRFVTSPRGLDTLRRTLMHHKEIFGKCPRPSCRGMPMLPHGESFPGRNSQRYCCSCGQVWEWWDSKVDGSAWGPSLCHLYLLTYGKASLGGVGSMPQQNPTATVPTIFGFQVHPAALRRLHEH